ncbi:capsid assembly scaffolding protein Gp46 family protein, partial [Staphylococcus pseudintermedius]|uniref:capsid assembly scaffolding protein Gp46 family protein n=1 Tax=Staphylococcus pseudintermedius TaxID=283734 RepID=UPI00358E0065
MKEQWLKLSLQFFNDAGTEEAVSDENVETEPTQEAEELSESQLKLVNDRVNEEMARRTKEMRQQIQDELTEKQKEADKLRKMNAEQKHQYELEKAEKERHSIAFARVEELRGRFSDTSRDGFLLAQDISAYSLTIVA